MARIFLVLAIFAIVLLAANFVVGLAGGDFNAAASKKREAQREFVGVQRQARAGGAAASLELGKAKQELAAADAAFRGPRSWMTLHMLLGSASALVTMLVHSIAITYFIGTSRWCKEVCDTYGLPRELAERSAVLKRRTFRWAVVGMLTLVVVVGLGAAADPTGANFQRSASFVMPHYLAAMLGLAMTALAFWIEITQIAENYAVIEQILADVRWVRQERNLAPEEAVA